MAVAVLLLGLFRQAVQISDGLISFGSCRKDGPLVALQNLEPGIDITSVVDAWLGRNANRCTQECGTEFGNQFLCGIGFAGESVAKIAGTTTGVACPMNQLMQCDAIVTLSVKESPLGWQVDFVPAGDIAGVVAAMPNGGRARLNEGISSVVSLEGRQYW